MGDFNAIRNPCKRKGGRTTWRTEDIEFDAACKAAELEELNSVGCYFTWSNRQVLDPILRRLDRVLGNAQWIQELSSSVATFLLPGISYHSPLTITITTHGKQVRNYPFKFFNFWLTNPDFHTILEEEWRKTHSGAPMYILYSKLRTLKMTLKAANRREFSNISERVRVA